MIAVIETGGKQYKVQQGDTLFVEKLDVNEGDKVIFDKVLLIEDSGEMLIGEPHLTGARVEGKAVKQGKARKVILIKKRRRKQYQRKQGHRQPFTQVVVDLIAKA
jgi:large subunit ribosomal protein L21